MSVFDPLTSVFECARIYKSAFKLALMGSYSIFINPYMFVLAVCNLCTLIWLGKLTQETLEH